MKKILYSLFILATTAMTFSSCEDVPAPFDFPNPGGDTPAPTIDPAGSGTQADPFNVAAAIEFTQQLEPGTESSQNIYIKGKVVEVIEEYTAKYGNARFTISDDGSARSTFLIYRANYLGNKKWAEGDTQIQVGDDVIICGIVTNYNGTLETQQNKAFLYSLNGTTAGGGGGGSDTPGEATGDGSLTNPWNAVAANNYASSLGADQESDKQYYIKGKISKIANNGEFSAQYGNATFYISDDGKASNEFYVYRTLYLGNKKWAAGDTQIKVGDDVVVCAKLVNYRGNTPETVQGATYLYSLNGQTGGGDTPGPGTEGEAKGSGTQSDPWNAVAANNFAKSLSADTPSPDSYYIKGKIAKIANNGLFSAQYGNASFYISDDGKDENTFYVFRTLFLENKKWVEGNTQIKVGDEVVIYGKLVNYRGNTPETQQNESYIYSLNGKTSDDGSGGGGGTDTPDDGSAGSYSNPYTVSAAISNNSGSGKYVKGFIVGWVSGQVLAEGAHFSADGCDVATNVLIASSASETDLSNCMPVQLPSGAVRTGLNLKDNPGNYKQEVLLYGNLEKYFGAPGLKSVTYAELGGNAIGTKP